MVQIWSQMSYINRFLLSIFSSSLVYLFRPSKFVEVNLFYLAHLPFLHCPAKQTSQYLARWLFSPSVQHDSVEKTFVKLNSRTKYLAHLIQFDSVERAIVELNRRARYLACLNQRNSVKRTIKKYHENGPDLKYAIMDLILNRYSLTKLKSSFPKNKPENMFIQIIKAVTLTNLIFGYSIPFHLVLLEFYFHLNFSEL